MSYKLILDNPNEEFSKDYGDKRYFYNLRSSYQVYLFYYAGLIHNNKLEAELRNFGKAKSNIYVHVGRIGSWDFDFSGEQAIILTAINKLASVQYRKFCSTVFVRLDNDELLRDEDKTIICIDKLFNLFNSSNISIALKQAKYVEQEAISSLVYSELKGVWDAKKEGISASLLKGKFEVRETKAESTEL